MSKRIEGLEEKLLDKVDEIIKSEKEIRDSEAVNDLIKIVEAHYDI